MDLAATSAGPWLVLGAVVGVLLAGAFAMAVAGLRPRLGRHRAPQEQSEQPEQPERPRPSDGAGWSVDDLPGFLEQPPGTATETETQTAADARAGTEAEVRLGRGSALLDAPDRPVRSVPVAADERGDRTGARLLAALTVGAVVLVGAAAGVAAVAGEPRGTAPGPRAEQTPPAGPTWSAPDVSGVPAEPSPGDPRAGRLAMASVPVGPEGALARAAFEGLVLERRAVGVTVTYPVVSVTVGEVPGGPALAHVRLPAWNCLGDTAPPDPVAAGCRRLPALHADLGTPALAVSSDGDGDGLRIEGRFPTYIRPAGSPPVWTGQVYPLSVTWTPDGGTVHLGGERARAVDDPRLTTLRLGR